MKLSRTVFKLILLVLLLSMLLAACDDAEESADAPAADVQKTAPSAQITGETWPGAFAAYIQDAMTETGIPGAALALVEGDQIILAEGYGLRNVEKGLPVTPDTLFHIGSTHKSMNAMLIAALVDDGILDWDDPIVDYAPDFALSDPDATESVTIRHLLSMTSGIPDDAEGDLDDDADAQDVLALIAETELLGAPGEVFSYSNLSATAAGYLAVLAVEGEAPDLVAAYGDLLRERVLDPIGMERATLSLASAQADPDHALSYALDITGAPELSETYDVEGDVLAPSGSLKASAREMALYILTQLNRGVAPNGNRVVSAENLAETWQPLLEDYALGWEVQTYSGVEMIVHTGAYDDFVSVIGFVPARNVGFVLLINSEEAGEALTEEAPVVLAQLLAE